MAKDLAGRKTTAKPAIVIIAAVVTLGLAAGAAALPIAASIPGGAVAGGLLFLAGLAELAAGAAPGLPEQQRAELMAGGATTLAGLLFLANPLIGLVPLSYIVIGWLFLRSLILLRAALRSGAPFRSWMIYAGTADVLLGLVLLVGLSLAALVVSWFGPTEEVVAHFSLIFAASFLVTGSSLLAMAGDELAEDENDAALG